MEFTSKLTQMTFTNNDGEKFIVREANHDADILEFHIEGRCFCISKKHAKYVAKTITNMAEHV